MVVSSETGSLAAKTSCLLVRRHALSQLTQDLGASDEPLYPDSPAKT
jgi:hypothetical protein